MVPPARRGRRATRSGARQVGARLSRLASPTFSSAQNNLPKWIIDFLRKKFSRNTVKKFEKYKKIYYHKNSLLNYLVD